MIPNGEAHKTRDTWGRVTDELLMNALYHAPVDQKGKALYREIPRGEISRVPLAAPVIVHPDGV